MTFPGRYRRLTHRYGEQDEDDLYSQRVTFDQTPTSRLGRKRACRGQISLFQP